MALRLAFGACAVAFDGALTGVRFGCAAATTAGEFMSGSGADEVMRGPLAAVYLAGRPWKLLLAIAGAVAGKYASAANKSPSKKVPTTQKYARTGMSRHPLRWITRGGAASSGRNLVMGNQWFSASHRRHLRRRCRRS